MNAAPLSTSEAIAGPNEAIVVTGAAGFIGRRVVDSLLRRGFTDLRCFVRPSTNLGPLRDVLRVHGVSESRVVVGSLLSAGDCLAATKGVSLVFHLAAGRGKSYPSCFANSVLTTRNLLEACLKHSTIKRFVNVSSFAVYSNLTVKRGEVFDESCPLEDDLRQRSEAYIFAKLKQDELVQEYHRKHGIPYSIVRPSNVFGPGKTAIPAAVGLGTFGVFLHLGHGNRVPLTFVDNCADAIVLCGLSPQANAESFNVVDDGLPTSRSFLRQYKRQVRRFVSIPVPYWAFNMFCCFWEWYCHWSKGQLPPVFNRRLCAFQWKGHVYSNEKLKELTGWRPEVSMADALRRYFESERQDHI